MALATTPAIINPITKQVMRAINCSNEGILRINKRLIVIPNATPIMRVGQKEKLINTFSLID
jgi:hypothetical protein